MAGARDESGVGAKMAADCLGSRIVLMMSVCAHTCVSLQPKVSKCELLLVCSY